MQVCKFSFLQERIILVKNHVSATGSKSLPFLNGDKFGLKELFYLNDSWINFTHPDTEKWNVDFKIKKKPTKHKCSNF